MERTKKAKIEPSDFDDLDALAEKVEKLDASQFMVPERRVRFDVKLKGTRNMIAVDSDLLQEVNKRARLKKTSSENLINLWVRQKLALPKSKAKVKVS